MVAIKSSELQESEDKKTRLRSPGYPTVSLREAVDRVRKLYDSDGKAGAPVDIAVRHIGFATAHGQAHSVMSALKKFGLVVGANGRIAPTQRAIEILKLPENDQRRIHALQEAALGPSIYRELIERYKDDGLPSDEALTAELETYRGFNPNAVEGFVKDFRDTLEFAGITDIGALESNGEGKEEMLETQTTETAEPKNQLRDTLVKQRTQQLQASQISTPVGTQDGQVVFAHVRFDADIRKEFVEKLKKYLDYLETTLQ